MIRYTPVFDSAEVQISRADHPPEHCHHDPPLEVGTDYCISRLERGSFAMQIGRQRWTLAPGSLFLHFPGMEYRCLHDKSVPTDVCLSLTYAPPSDDDPESAIAFERVARMRPVPPPSNRLAYLFLRLARSAEQELLAEETAYAVQTEIISQSESVRKPYREYQLRWYAERVDAARRHMEHHYSTEHRLAWLGRMVGMSPFHFARIFRELVGVPPHSYLLRVRLRKAAWHLDQGASVTEACFNSGFQHLSHFSRHFHRHFGVKPSAYLPGIPRQSQPQTNCKK